MGEGVLKGDEGREKGRRAGMCKVVMKPGPLHGDIESIASAFNAAMVTKVASLKRRLLCKYCSLPGCQCSVCSFKLRDGLSAKTNQQGGHTCIMKGKRGPPAADRSAQFKDEVANG